jgi:hypothetical protein
MQPNALTDGSRSHVEHAAYLKEIVDAYQGEVRGEAMTGEPEWARALARLARQVWIVDPQPLARPDVDGVHHAPRGADLYDAVHHHRRGLHPARGLEVVGPPRVGADAGVVDLAGRGAGALGRDPARTTLREGAFWASTTDQHGEGERPSRSGSSHSPANRAR